MDPLSVSASILAIAGAAIASSQALYKAVQSFVNHGGTLSRLVDVLRALEPALRSLEKSAADDEALFLTLKLPLVQCDRVCRQFAVLLAECARHGGLEGNRRTSIRDWLKFQYRGKDVRDLVDELDGYKDIINIALAVATLKTSKVTLEVLNRYKDMVQRTWGDFEERIDAIDAKLDILATSPSTESGAASAPAAAATAAMLRSGDIARAEEQRDSAELCLEICTNLQAQINEMWFQPVLNDVLPRTADGSAGVHASVNGPGSETTAASIVSISAKDLTRAHITMLSGIKDCTETVARTLSQLSLQHQDATSLIESAHASQHASSSAPTEVGNEDGAEEAQRLADEKSCFKSCAAFCDKASQQAERVHVIDNVSVGKNGQQIIVSSFNDLFHVSHVTAGEDSVQMIGITTEAVILETLRSRGGVGRSQRAALE